MFLNWPDPEQYRICQLQLTRWLVAGALLMVLGCGPASPPDPRANQMVYFDRATKNAVVYNVSREMPVIHPRTGMPTLVPALYCVQCQKWFPAPPIEVRERNPKAMICPKKHPLSHEGPWPDEVL